MRWAAAGPAASTAAKIRPAGLRGWFMALLSVQVVGKWTKRNTAFAMEK